MQPYNLDLSAFENHEAVSKLIREMTHPAYERQTFAVHFMTELLWASGDFGLTIVNIRFPSMRLVKRFGVRGFPPTTTFYRPHNLSSIDVTYHCGACRFSCKHPRTTARADSLEAERAIRLHVGGCRMWELYDEQASMMYFEDYESMCVALDFGAERGFFEPVDYYVQLEEFS